MAENDAGDEFIQHQKLYGGLKVSFDKFTKEFAELVEAINETAHNASKVLDGGQKKSFTTRVSALQNLSAQLEVYLEAAEANLDQNQLKLLQIVARSALVAVKDLSIHAILKEDRLKKQVRLMQVLIETIEETES